MRAVIIGRTQLLLRLLWPLKAVEAVISGVYTPTGKPDLSPIGCGGPFDARVEHHAAAVLFGIVVKTGELAEHVELRFAEINFASSRSGGA